MQRIIQFYGPSAVDPQKLVRVCGCDGVRFIDGRVKRMDTIHALAVNHVEQRKRVRPSPLAYRVESWDGPTAGRALSGMINL